MRLPAIAALALVLAGCQQSASVNVVQPSEATAVAWDVKLRASDGVTVFGRFRAAEHPKGLLLLFHQAGSSKDEYAEIGDRLREAGYSSLAIDQRAGGDLFGPNQTVAALGHAGSYAGAKRDLEAALHWAGNKHLPVILWGSSYSAALVFLVAAEHPGQVRAMLAFSPAEYLDDRQLVHRAAATLAVPVFVTSAQKPDEIDAARSILAAVPAAGKQQFVPAKGGVHGSSTLIPARNPIGAEAAWTAVLGFLDAVTRR